MSATNGVHGNHVAHSNGNGTQSNGNGTQSNGVTAVLSPTADETAVALLAKLEAANRQLEADSRTAKSLTPPSKSHSRQGSIASVGSVVSNTSVSSSTSTNMDDISSPEGLWEIWGRLVSDWDNVVKRKASFIRELVRRGIPHHFRGIVWQLLCNAQDCPVKEKYSDYLKTVSPCEKMIRRDITRTYPDQEFFKEKDGLGQESLFNVMKAYSLEDREVGYCQGSGFIVGLILMQQMPEEEAFAVTVKIMQDYRMRDIFKPSMAELGLCMFQLECMIQESLPELHHHFQAQNFHVSMFASSWFLTLFAQTLPLPLACRVFDVFLVEGLEMIFRVGFALLQLTEQDLLYKDMEGMIRFLQKDMPIIISSDPDLLLNTAFNIRFNNKKMKKLEKEYNALKSREQEEQVELRRLRTENRLLRQRIDNLEKETGTLADRLIHDQVKYAQQAEEIFVLRRDLSVTRQQVTNQLEEINRSDSRSSASDPDDLRCRDERIEQLETQLDQLSQQLSEGESTINQLKNKIKDVENQNEQLSQEPVKESAQLQEELIASKLREAEANLGLKELQQKVHDLDKHYQKYQERQQLSNVKVTKEKCVQLADDLMAVRIKEAQSVAELTETKLKLMELETQNHICERQIKRQQDDSTRLQGELDTADNREKELQHQASVVQRKISDMETQKKEDEMMSKIRDAEHAQSIAEMRNRIAELEIENQELVTASTLSDKGDRDDLENKISDLQDEVLQLKMARRLQSLSSLAVNNISVDSESDYDVEEQTLHLGDMNLGMSANMGHPRPTELQSSDTESLQGSSDSATKHKVYRKKKKGKRESSDMDKTPTQDSVNGTFFACPPQMSASFSEFSREGESAGVDHVTVSQDHKLSQSVTGELPVESS